MQITVTSTEVGPAYIRFMDSDMQPFGTDVDEEEANRGADVVGLDSQGRLTMTRTTLTAAEALVYDPVQRGGAARFDPWRPGSQRRTRR